MNNQWQAVEAVDRFRLSQADAQISCGGVHVQDKIKISMIACASVPGSCGAVSVPESYGCVSRPDSCGCVSRSGMMLMRMHACSKDGNLSRCDG
eukprot:scaffold28090_cov18-Tisochrysis_lutea.AAC.5